MCVNTLKLNRDMTTIQICVCVALFFVNSAVTFSKSFVEPGSSFAEMEFPSQDVSKMYSILCSAKFEPFSNPFGTAPGAVHDERAE